MLVLIGWWQCEYVHSHELWLQRQQTRRNMSISCFKQPSKESLSLSLVPFFKNLMEGWGLMLAVCLCVSDFLHRRKRSIAISITHITSSQCLIQISGLMTVKAIAHRVQNFHTLESKYDLTLCESRLLTASETFVRHKIFGIGFDFLCFFASTASILRGVLTIQSLRTSKRQNPEWRLSNSSTSSRSTKHRKDPCTLSSQKLVVFFLICGSSFTSKASNWATDILK